MLAAVVQDAVAASTAVSCLFHMPFLMQLVTVWQGAVASVNAFPYTPDVVGHVDAMAEEAGEPSAETLHAAAFAAADHGDPDQGDDSALAICAP